jgi:hypothetical protein
VLIFAVYMRITQTISPTINIFQKNDPDDLRERLDRDVLVLGFLFSVCDLVIVRRKPPPVVWA